MLLCGLGTSRSAPESSHIMHEATTAAKEIWEVYLGPCLRCWCDVTCSRLISKFGMHALYLKRGYSIQGKSLCRCGSCVLGEWPGGWYFMTPRWQVSWSLHKSCHSCQRFPLYWITCIQFFCCMQCVEAMKAVWLLIHTRAFWISLAVSVVKLPASYCVWLSGGRCVLFKVAAPFYW